jgi:predicted amidohydrolase YtcJ
VRTLLLAAALATTAAAQQPAPDAIFYNAHILTGAHLLPPQPGQAPDPTPATVTALATFAGRVLALGDDPTVLALKAPNTQLIDLHGAFVMPGFNDAHTHTESAGLQRLSLDLDHVPTLAAMLDKIHAYALTLKPGEWIEGGGWDHTRWPTKTLPTRQDLDRVTLGHPALLVRTDGHIAIANSAALEAASLTSATPDPQGGHLDRDAHGDLTGIVREGPALTLVEAHIPPPSFETIHKALALSIQDAIAHGVTSIQDFSSWNAWLAYEELEKQNKLPLRVAEWIDFTLPLATLQARRASHSPDDLRLHLTQLKAFMDGSLGSRTAALNDDYSDDAGNPGITRFDQQKLNEMSSARAAQGFQLGFHAIGDHANDIALNAFAAAEQTARPADCPPPIANPDGAVVEAGISCVITGSPTQFRFRIEHAQVVSPGAFDRFAQLGVIASMQPSHLLTDMAWAGQRLGPDRSSRAYAWKSFLDHGVLLAFGTDYPVESVNPMRGLYAAITRMNVEGTQTFHPEQKITLNQALYAYTQGSAFAEFRDRVKGRLAPHFLADFVVLDHDLTTSTPQQILHTRVLRTVVNGQTVYTAP